jgi:hypothetical protein
MIPSNPISLAKNLKIPYSVTLPAVTNSTFGIFFEPLGSSSFYYSTLAEEFQRTLWSKVSQQLISPTGDAPAPPLTIEVRELESFYSLMVLILFKAITAIVVI